MYAADLRLVGDTCLLRFGERLLQGALSGEVGRATVLHVGERERSISPRRVCPFVALAVAIIRALGAVALRRGFLYRRLCRLEARFQLVDVLLRLGEGGAAFFNLSPVGGRI